MKYVYVIRYMGVNVFSTANKAATHLKECYSDWEFGDYGEEIQLDTLSSEEISRKLRKGEYLIFQSGMDSVEAFKEIVQ